MADVEPLQVRFDVFELDEADARLTRAGRPIALAPKASAARSLANSGMTPDAVRSTLDNLLQGQSVMLATNELMFVVGAVFVVAAFMIWLAPRPTRAVNMMQAGH